MAGVTLREFLKPLAIDAQAMLGLAHELESTFTALCASSPNQFLPTPISESILDRAGRDRGRYFAIDIGGSNLRVGFVELLGDDGAARSHRLNRVLEESWPIQDHLKNENAEGLFSWIGDRIAHVVRKGRDAFGLAPDDELPMGVTFSFPMQQRSLTEAILMPMGKGFAITSNLDLAQQLMAGYQKHRTPDMPSIRIAAIVNDAVATLVSTLHENKRPESISVLPNQRTAHVKIAVNTEWTIKGSAPPLHKLGLVSRWDTELDQDGEAPGFQPLEYMTAGRYLGELARLIFIDYYKTVLGLPVGVLPAKLRQRFGLTTTFISHLYPGSPKGSLLSQVEREFPPENGSFRWTNGLSDALHHIAKAIEVRAAGIIAAAIVGLLRCAKEIADAPDAGKTELAVGYTGGCIEHFQNYKADTQRFLDEILDLEFGGRPPVKVVLTPCHDGGITGAGLLVPAALASRKV